MKQQAFVTLALICGRLSHARSCTSNCQISVLRKVRAKLARQLIKGPVAHAHTHHLECFGSMEALKRYRSCMKEDMWDGWVWPSSEVLAPCGFFSSVRVWRVPDVGWEARPVPVKATCAKFRRESQSA